MRKSKYMQMSILYPQIIKLAYVMQFDSFNPMRYIFASVRLH